MPSASRIVAVRGGGRQGLWAPPASRALAAPGVRVVCRRQGACGALAARSELPCRGSRRLRSSGAVAGKEQAPGTYAFGVYAGCPWSPASVTASDVGKNEVQAVFRSPGQTRRRVRRQPEARRIDRPRDLSGAAAREAASTAGGGPSRCAARRWVRVRRRIPSAAVRRGTGPASFA